MLPFLHAVFKYLAFNPVIKQVSLGVILMLVLLLILKEFVRSSENSQRKFWLRRFDLAIVPLIFIFVLIMVVRFLSL